MATFGSSKTAPRWSPETRSWVSLLLFAHLFAIFVACVTYTRPSGLEQSLHGLFAPYLRNLHLTAYGVAYPFARYYLTHATENDLDFTCEVDVAGRDGASDKVVIPPNGLWPPVRFRRYQNLANAVGTLAAGADANEEYTAILPKAIAGSIIREHDAAQGTFRCRSVFLPDIEAMGEIRAGRRKLQENTVYEAQVFVSPGGVELLKKSQKLEVAPVEKSPRSPSKSPP
jgi:hypothetical protein